MTGKRLRSGVIIGKFALIIGNSPLKSYGIYVYL